ncbi:uncharacterized protein LOC133821148 [Humulus lupulus]|uniref:uncharacterized protein LOC133821148 n=1 Tax=Humulus lupulus TaxID=3486 RepID=UPI002B40980D|nr:uncharacterized protein LOC133821148 [Humulus lupulus]
MEYLTRRLQLATRDSSFRHHPMCKSLNLLNLCFADDLLLFCKGTMASVQVLKKALEEFSSVSGLAINTSKSHVYFGGVPVEDRKRLATELQLTEGSFPLKYLGAPMRLTKWKHEDCDIVIQKFRSIIKEIEKLCRSFLWGVNGNRSKIHLASWNKIPQDTSWYWRKLCKLRDIYSYGEIKAAGHAGKFHSSQLYNNSLCQQQVGYHKVVWCRLSLPKHRFVLWQTVNAYLLTCDNLVRFKVMLDSQLCPVCGVVNESLGHLFFDCYLSRQVLILIFSWLGFQAWPIDFPSWLVWLANRRSGVIADIIFSVLAAVVYGIWRNRNQCVFYSCSWTANSIATDIKGRMKYRFFIVNNRKLSALEQRFLDRLTM